MPRIPASTYRVQFGGHFRFIDAVRIIGYLDDLGISDIYASPYLKAKKGSLHGYDIIDHNKLNPEVGTEGEYDELADELLKYRMGQILDFVPNHMCIMSNENEWWIDILENGPSSIYANWFDIDWRPVKKELENKVLIPVLAYQYGNVLEQQELRLTFEEGTFSLCYYEHKFPIQPKTYIDILKFRLEELEKLLSPENPYYVELLSIITALNYLPHYTETKYEKIVERDREKEIIKKRLWDLCNESEKIKAFIDENVQAFNGVKGEPRSFDNLDALLSQQVYRLSHWRVATEEINYRRFFDINDLAAIRMEDIIVFRQTHQLLFKLIRGKKITGLRVDHPDGLYNPSEYFHRLQRWCFVQTRLGYTEPAGEEAASSLEPSENEQELLKQYDRLLSSDPSFKPFYIVGEKILTKGEKMPEEWPIFSTTGYVFLNSVSGIFVDTRNAKAFDDIYNKFIRTKTNFQEIVYEKKKLAMQVTMSSEINTLGHYLNRISEKNRHTRDFTLNSLIRVIVEVIAFFPVYRTYINNIDIKDRDRQYIETAVSKAKRANPAISESIFNFLRDVLLLKFPEEFGEEDKREWLDFVMRFQQLTSPVMAKGIEDTSFYVYNRFVSLNEVGGNPDRFGTPLETFHGQNIERIKFWPHALIATSTHDTKRSEDVRARLNVLSEIPAQWQQQTRKWSRLNKKSRITVDGRIVPDRNEEYLLYQTLLGAWPVNEMENSGYEDFKKRIKDYMLKAVREAKVNTSWINPDALYEDAIMTFIETIMKNTPDNQFLQDFLPFQKMISHYGMYNSLSMTLLKTASPGVPDFYQGTEIWDFSLVDPDNRRPVNYDVRIKMLEALKKRESETNLSDLARELTEHKENGMIKLYLIYKALNYRKQNRELFDRGEYLPLEIMERRADQVCAFARRAADRMAIVAAPRFFTKIIPQPTDLPLGQEIWRDSFIAVPLAEAGATYFNIFTGERFETKRYKNATVLDLSRVFANFPVALVEGFSG
ncbi:MAG: malto-oligosyltrehalose synthase [Nitrospirota bacterium]